MDDRSDSALVAELHEQLAATGERPVERSAARFLGEAEAVAADLDGADLPPPIVRERVDVIGDLLSHIDETGDPVADEHLERARECVGAISDEPS